MPWYDVLHPYTHYVAMSHLTEYTWTPAQPSTVMHALGDGGIRNLSLGTGLALDLDHDALGRAQPQLGQPLSAGAIHAGRAAQRAAGGDLREVEHALP